MALLTDYPADSRWLVAALQDIQAQCGHIPAEILPQLSSHFGLSSSELAGWVGVGQPFGCEPPAVADVTICTGAVCRAKGADRLFALAAKSGKLVATTFCLGFCLNPPAARFGRRAVGNVTTKRFHQLIGKEE